MMFSIYGGDLIYCKQKLLVKNRRSMLNVFDLIFLFYSNILLCFQAYYVNEDIRTVYHHDSLEENVCLFIYKSLLIRNYKETVMFLCVKR